MYLGERPSDIRSRILQYGYISLICAFALLPALVQFVFGVSLTGPHAAADGPFTVGALNQFADELKYGHWPPRWAATGNSGLGSPIFFFYPPAVYYMSASLLMYCPQLSAATVIGLMGIFFRFLAIVTCAMWLRIKVSAPSAIIGGAFYALMPYISFYNPQYRLAFAETGASFIMPLVFLAVDVGYGKFCKTVVLVAVAISLLALFHLPSTVITCGLILIYAGMHAASVKKSITDVLPVFCGIILGLGIAAFNIFPAITLLPEIASSSLQKFGWQGFFLLRFQSLTNPYYILIDFCLLAPLAAGCIGIRSSCASERWRPVTSVFIIAVLLTVPLSWPIWKIFTVLQRVQFPWRFLLPVSLMAAGLLTYRLQSLKKCSKAYLAIAVGLVSLATAAGSIWMSAYPLSGTERTHLAMTAPYVDAPEYVPALAAAKGWDNFHQKGGDMHLRSSEFISRCAPAQEHLLKYDVRNCAGTIVLPQFYFPGWAASDARDKILEVKSDPKSGLVSVDITTPTSEVYLKRNPLPQEKVATYVSIFALLLLAGLVVYAAHFHKRHNSAIA